ncbi:MAG: protease inhibitor I42 family protein [Hyphomicrobiales bacterium]|nr:protease inhibitor I42 family protein [Hyphomicrobiales bacterium]
MALKALLSSRLTLLAALGVAVLACAVIGFTAMGDDHKIGAIRDAKVGQKLILDFPGNRVAAHRWRLVKEKSRGLELVEVSPIGWIISPERTSLYANEDTMRFGVLAKAPGRASLTFEHNYRGWANRYYFRWETIEVVISGDRSP